MEWIKVKDRLPEKEGRYLICWNDGQVEDKGFSNNLFFWDADCCSSDEHFDEARMKMVTYWMPLPQPPKE